MSKTTADMSFGGRLTAGVWIRFWHLMGNGWPDLAWSHVLSDLHRDEQECILLIESNLCVLPAACKLPYSHLCNILDREKRKAIIFSFLFSFDTCHRDQCVSLFCCRMVENLPLWQMWFRGNVVQWEDFSGTGYTSAFVSIYNASHRQLWAWQLFLFVCYYLHCVFTCFQVKISEHLFTCGWLKP